MKQLLTVLAFAALPFLSAGQTLNLETAVANALENYPSVLAARAEVSRQSALRRAAIDIPATELSLTRGQFNSIMTDENFTISQTFPFPLTLARQRKLSSEVLTSSRLNEEVKRNELVYEVKMAFNQLLYLKARRAILKKQDSLAGNLLNAASLQFETGEVPMLTKVLAETQRLETRNELERIGHDIDAATFVLRSLCQTEFDSVVGTLEDLFGDVDNLEQPSNTPAQRYIRQNVRIATEERKLASARMLPDIKIGYFNQTLIGTQNIDGHDVYFDRSKRFDGFQFGLVVPLWVGSHLARTKAFIYAEEQALRQVEQADAELLREYERSLQEMAKNQNTLKFYQDTGLETANLLQKQLQLAFRNGEADLSSMLMAMKQSLNIEEQYLSALFRYNESVISIQYLNGIN